MSNDLALDKTRVNLYPFACLQRVAVCLGMPEEDKRLLDAFYFHCRVRNLRPYTLKCYAERLKYLCVWATELDKGLIALSRHDIEQYILSRIGRVSDETVNGLIRVFRVFYNFLESEGELPENPMRRIRLIKVDRHMKNILMPVDVIRILNSFDRSSFLGQRNYVATLIFYDAMIRVTELSSITLNDCHLKEKYLIVTHSKTRQERWCPISDKTAKAIHTYMWRFRSKIPMGDRLICNLQGDPVTRNSLRIMYYRLGKRLGLRLYCHLFRHSAASRYIMSGGSATVLQHVLGHDSIQTTKRYLHLQHSHELIREHEKYSPVANLTNGG